MQAVRVSELLSLLQKGELHYASVNKILTLEKFSPACIDNQIMLKGHLLICNYIYSFIGILFSESGISSDCA
jgi:hypothetical protein